MLPCAAGPVVVLPKLRSCNQRLTALCGGVVPFFFLSPSNEGAQCLTRKSGSRRTFFFPDATPPHQGFCATEGHKMVYSFVCLFFLSTMPTFIYMFSVLLVRSLTDQQCFLFFFRFIQVQRAQGAFVNCSKLCSIFVLLLQAPRRADIPFVDWSKLHAAPFIYFFSF